MACVGYYRSRRGWRPIRGFRVSSSRLSIHRLRFRFFDFIKLLRRWRLACNQALEAIKKGMRRSRKRSSDGSKRGLVGESKRYGSSRPDYKLRSYGRSNSFYAEAIADCLEFIKRSAVAMDGDRDSNSLVSRSSAH